ncbi:RagB/SusD family nutrient uptake outer membrane protein [Chitinophaga sp. S165]|uniref:RagB/SusD family nutrient uptake outer membrane protein n=1 Tax=Chitinophaga sp. S165 TaxID=2135462 RepID=UPI000D7178E8|nr:RagB/SusD family nutrient uptake outer membrane protein [Chitinophaga sp. S165]PWV47092.1 putative outer membrane starch-binding protein [Chitinophaga sp. S165]
MIYFLTSTNRYILLISVNLLIAATGCKKLLAVDPPGNSLNAANVFTTDATAIAVVTDIYAGLSAQNINQQNQAITSLSLYGGLSADEITLFDNSNSFLQPYFTNDVISTTGSLLWNNAYQIIFKLNAAIEGLDQSTSITPVVKQQLLGEAKFMLGFLYFHLVNLYGDVPLVLNTDYIEIARMSRTPSSKVYDAIIEILTEAKQLLSADYLKSDLVGSYSAGSEERIRPTKWAAAALLSRAYLYIKNYASAAAQASEVIGATSYYGLLPDLTAVFKKNSRDSIWQLQPIGNNANANTGEGKIFVLPNTGPSASGYPVYLNTDLVNAFESGDLRREQWVKSVSVGPNTYSYPYKYQVGNVSATTQEYSTVLRLSELYLIRAEAKTYLNDVSGAQSDLNLVRKRAGLGDTPADDQHTLVTAILKERRVELFTEWAHRWMDLKRTGTIDVVMSVATPQKGGTWQSYKALLPIPEDELRKALNLRQNPGYN